MKTPLHAGDVPLTPFAGWVKFEETTAGFYMVTYDQTGAEVERQQLEPNLVIVTEEAH